MDVFSPRRHRLRLLFVTVLLASLSAAVGCRSDTATPSSSSADSAATGAAPSPAAPTMPPPDSVTAADIPADSVTNERFQRVMHFARRANLAERPPGQAIQALGRYFLGRPYLVGPLDQTLDQNPPEQLVCRLDGFDCFTFDEAVLALARTVDDGSYSYDKYKDYTRKQAEEQGVLKNITRQIGGRRNPDKRYGFMSAHRGEYPQLESDSLYLCIQQVEKRLNRTMDYYYVPQDSIRAVYGKLKAGDLISTATDIDGLDVTHTGLVYKKADTTGLLHASTSGSVKISPDLQRYVQGVDSQIGIIVARPVFGEGESESASASSTR
ncbi:MAG: DUF1460 domain-containing protein [Bacteroidetes bacterium QS_7_67_15]|nr:MAG: DUF1460 domain-containing protein [Bacteroidetes bacterium QS_7_67_15]